jgi:hypothetical protein
VPWGAGLRKGLREQAEGKAMSLRDVSLAHAREVPTRSVMEGVLVSSEGEMQGDACACQRIALPHATSTEGHRLVTPVLLSCQTMARPTLGGGVAGPGGTAQAGSGGLCLRRPAACAHTEEVDPCPPTCTFPSKTMTRS